MKNIFAKPHSCIEPLPPLFVADSNRKRQLKIIGLLALLLQLFIAGCQSTGIGTSSPHPLQRIEVDSTAGSDTGGRISLFLNLKRPDNNGVRMDVSKIEILNDTIWLPITSHPLEIDAAEIGSGQIFLGRGVLPAGRYQRLRFTLQHASIGKEDGTRVFLALDSLSLELPIAQTIDLKQGDSQSLFISWDEEASLRTPPLLKPDLTIIPNLKQMATDLAYATCPEINTVYVMRTDKNWVCDSFGVTGNPTYLTTTSLLSEKRLYILTPAEAAIKVVELPENIVIDSFHIPMTIKPSFMTLSSDGQWAYILDSQDDYLLRINLSSGNMSNRVHLGYQPEYAAYIESHNLLAVGATISQSISLLDANTLAEVGEIPTTGSPKGLLAWNDMLYISEGDANTITIYDLNSRTIDSRLNVGFYPHRLLQNNNRIYVSNRDSRSISIIQPGQLGIAREIYLNGRPQEMTVEENSKWLYVGNRDIGGLSVIDATINRVSGEILFGAAPAGLAVLQ
ncbi:MAG: hypothetical protein OEL66_04040 [Desulfobulbaceae bacterium]|nr:hypothetical protein [Desulfobulbaceae bacterium]